MPVLRRMTIATLRLPITLLRWNPVNTTITGSYTVTYNVSDSASNAAVEMTRTVNVVDTTVPVITLLGDDPVTVECGGTYEDAGATATDTCDGDLTTAITLGGDTLNTGVAGTYVLAYNVLDLAGNAADEVTRTINVVDTTAPTIALLGDNPATAECGGEYEDAGATATDVCEGDLTYAIEVAGDTVDTAVPGAYTLTYDVADAALNAAAQVTRTVNVVDTTKPVITLTGDTEVTVEVGNDYVDEGATAADTCGGDLTGSITVGGDTVDVNTLGMYTITYDVADPASNQADQVTRRVYVVDTEKPYLVDVWVNNDMTGRTVKVQFSKEMGNGVLTPANYTLSGSGQGSLTENPDTVELSTDEDPENTYLLTWNARRNA